MSYPQHSLPWRFFLLALATWSAGPSNAAAVDTKPIRVALTTFTTDDNSYRSTQAAADLASALQAELSAEPGLIWVERDESAVVEGELELSELGLPDAKGALRRGRFHAADWLLTGSFAVHSSNQWKLTVEIIDARRADVLAAHGATLSRATHPTLRSALSQLPAIAAEVRRALNAAATRWNAVAGRPTLALLMLLDAEEVEPQLAAALEAPTNAAWRVSRVGRAGQAFGGTEMTLLGLVEQSPDEWEKLADAYVWGRLAVRRLPGVLGVVPVLEVKWWDGRSQVATVSVKGEPVSSQNAALTQATNLGPRLATSLWAAMSTPSARSSPVETRARIAQDLFELAGSWRANTEHWSRWRTNAELWVQHEFAQQLRMLDIACFFDPRNQAASELMLGVQEQNSYNRSTNRFWHALRQSQAWRSYYNRFGLPPYASPRPHLVFDDATIKKDFFISAYSLVYLSQMGDKENYGFPRDMAGSVARKWLGEFSSELIRRVLLTIDQPTTAGMARMIILDGLTGNPRHLLLVEPKLRRQGIEALWPAFVGALPPGSRREDHEQLCDAVSATYAELNLAGQEQRLLLQLNKPKAPVTNGPVQLPRAAEFKQYERLLPPRPTTPK